MTMTDPVVDKIVQKMHGPSFKHGDHVRSDRYEGVAMWYLAGCEYHYGCVLVRMVGDDATIHLGETEIVPLDEDEFCGSCGQIGCGHG